MRFSTASAIFFAASIAAAIAYPSRSYYGPVGYDDVEYPGGKNLWNGRSSYSLASAPFYYQARTLELEAPTGRKYKVTKKQKEQAIPIPISDEEEEEDDEPQDDQDESSEEDEEEEDEESESMDIPPWQKLFPEEDKNTGTFNDQPPSGYDGQSQSGYGSQSPSGYGDQSQNGYRGQNPSGSNDGIPGGAPAPESSGSLMSLFTGGSGGSSSGPQNDHGHSGQQKYRQGHPPQYQKFRARTSLPAVEEPRSGGAVLYDGYRYIPVQLQQRQSKKIKPTQQKPAQGRSIRLTPRQSKKQSNNANKKFVLVPVQRDSREIRFSRDQHGFRVESGPMYAPTEIWRWEGAGGPPIRRRETRPAGPYYAPKPHRGSTSPVRFADEENDY